MASPSAAGAPAPAAIGAQQAGDVLRLARRARHVDLVEGHLGAVAAQRLHLRVLEAVARVEDGSRRQVGRHDEEAARDVGPADLARGRRHRRVEAQDGLGRLLLVPGRDREDAPGPERAHVRRHRLARVGELLHDREAARARQSGGVREREVDHVVAVALPGEVQAPVMRDHGDVGPPQDVAGEGAQLGVVEECVEHAALALRDRDVARARRQRQRGRQAAAELHDEGLRRLAQQVRVDHRQVAVVGGLLRREAADDPLWPLPVDIEAPVGALRHLLEVEGRVVGQARREMQVGALVDLEQPEGRAVLEHEAAVRELARVADALVVGHGEARHAEPSRQQEMRGDARDRRHDHRDRAPRGPRRRRPAQRAGEPERDREDDEVGGREHVERRQQGEAAQARAEQVGEVDAVERRLRALEHHAEEQGPGEERHQVEQHRRREPPFLRRVGDEEDRVEADLLGEQVAAHGQRRERRQRQQRELVPPPPEPGVGDAHRRAGQAEAEHGEADHERAEMRPAADREEAHDRDLERDQRAGDQRRRPVGAPGQGARDWRRHLLWVPLITPPSSLVKGTKGTMRPP
jgi:hypothetical protein